MGSQISYNLETDLTVPTDVPLKAIRVRVEIDPKSAACLIYGHLIDGDLGYVQVSGGQTEIDLPFCRPHIYVQYLQGLKNLRISTLGWTERRE